MTCDISGPVEGYKMPPIYLSVRPDLWNRTHH